MPKPRKTENKGLPARWRFVRNAYYYQVPPGRESEWEGKKTYRLGRTLPEAYAKWAEKVGEVSRVTNVGELLTRYAREVLPYKPAKVRAERARHIAKLTKVFGTARLTAIEPRHIYLYVTERRKKKKDSKGRLLGGLTAARHEVATLSHALSKAVEWGLISKHPFKGEVRIEGEKPRTRYVKDEELVAALSLPSVRKRGSVHTVHGYLRLKLLTGLRRGDLLRLRVSDFTESGLEVTIRKTGKAVIYEWTEELRTAFKLALEARPVDVSPWLFCTRRGECYFKDDNTADPAGWNSMWQNWLDRVMEETGVKVRFTEHDIRAKVGSDAESLERARQLLAHVDSRTTNRIYRRKAEIIKPTR